MKDKGRGQRAKGDGKGKGTEGRVVESIDDLYQLALTEFTPARNGLAARLRKSGRAADADEVRSLVKPSIPAWAVNQLFWRHRLAFDRLLTSGDRLRHTQSSTLAGKSGDVRGALDAVREALSELSRLASDELAAVGHNPSPGVMRAVTATLEALSSYGTSSNAPPAGRLVDEVDPPGFETLAALVPNASGASIGDAPSRVLRFRQEKPPSRSARGKSSDEDPERLKKEREAKIAAAKALVRESDRSLREALATAQQAQASLKKAAAHAKDSEQALVDAERVFEKAATEAHSARQTARRLAVEAEAAAQAVEEAERAVERAKEELRGLE